MNKRFAYIYFMKNDPEKIRSIVSLHVEYWKNLRLLNYQGGPFNDRSGGLIIFNADGIEYATRTVNNDPFITEGLIERKWLKEWIPE